MWAVKEEDLGQVDIDDEANARRGKMYIPNWFSVEVKTRVRKILHESTLPWHDIVLFAQSENLDPYSIFILLSAWKGVLFNYSQSIVHSITFMLVFFTYQYETSASFYLCI